MKENIFTCDNENYSDVFNKEALKLLCSVILTAQPLKAYEFTIPHVVSAH